MVSLTKPNDLVGAFAPAQFILTTDSEDSIEVKILDGQENLLGTKRMSGSLEYKINVANYASRMLDVKPVAEGECGFVAFGDGRLAQVEVVVDDEPQTSDGVAVITASRRELAEMEVMSMLPMKREITASECDEVAMVVPQEDIQAVIKLTDKNGLDVTLEPYEISGSENRVVSFVLDMADVGVVLEEQFGRLIDDFVSLELSIGYGQSWRKVSYDIVPQDSDRVRLCWWNDYGTVDYYSFYESGESKISADKYIVKTATGYKTECVGVETRREFSTKAVSKSEADGVSTIIYAQAVWLMDGGERQVVFVDTPSVEQSQSELPSVCIEVSQVGFMDN